jgi:putative ATP-dependent endonuclease of OLD family
LKGDTDKLRLFRSAVFVPIDGIDFVPYARLLLTAQNGVRIADRVVIITDGDKGKSEKDKAAKENEADDADLTGDSDQIESLAASSKMAGIPGELRKKELIDLAKKLGAENHLAVVTNVYSLESELLESSNEAIMRKAYLTIHPKSHDKWDQAAALSGDERAHKIHDIFEDTRKGDFAQVLAELIEKGEDFTVPDYLGQAIKDLVD